MTTATTYTRGPSFLKPLYEKKKYPYFFKNENIDDNTYIVQHSHNISNALYILDIWKREKYNIGGDEDIPIGSHNINEIPHTKYLYNSNDNIEHVDINGGIHIEGYENNKILLYKKDDKIYYSALLKFN